MRSVDALLLTLAEYDLITVKLVALAALACMSRTSVIRSIRELKAKGYIVVEKPGKILSIRLTEAGQKRVQGLQVMRLYIND